MAPNVRILWSRDECVKLIELYESHACLYETTSVNYRNKNMRQAALESIANIMRELRPEVTANLVKLKLSNLRTQYCDASQKIRASGCSSGQIAKPTLWCYNMLSFLQPHIVHTKPVVTHPGQQQNSGEACARSVQVIAEDTDEDSNCFDDTLEAELEDRRTWDDSQHSPSRMQETVVERTSRRSFMDTSSSRGGSQWAPNPCPSRGSKRRADSSPSASELFFEDARAAIADLVAKLDPPREQDPFSLTNFGKFVASEMMLVNDPLAIIKLKEEILSLIQAEQLKTFVTVKKENVDTCFDDVSSSK